MLQRFLSLVSAHPDAVAVIEGDTGLVLSRAALLARAEEMAARLAAAGLRASDAVAMQLPNSSELIATVIAALQLKLVIVPIDRDASDTEVATILGHFSIKGLAYRDDRGSHAVAISTRAVTSRPNVPAETRLIKLTSGSTGRPKGIAVSEANLIADALHICTTMDIHPSDRNLGAIPLSHSYGFSNLVTPLLIQGTPVVVSNDYLPQSLIELANRYGCTVVPLIPMVFEHLTAVAHGHFETVRTFLSAGAPLPASTSRRFRERFGTDVHSFYGCSECGGITYDRAGAAVERGSVGEPMVGVTLTVDGPRLRVRSEAVALGYLFDAETFEPFEAGAFQTDDLVELRDGEVFLTGRASDLINTAGKKVNPREVEAVLLQIEGVLQVKVYGEQAGARGEVVAAAIVATPNVTREQIREFCRARLSLHKVPRILKLIDRIPVDERGKVKRAALAML
ncbi:MAG TPA: class I adenylate-forming enzyme family protein [Thermoanaerobaculia bacterium]|jgi:long-chain acyl-CoA synthetase